MACVPFPVGSGHAFDGRTAVRPYSDEVGKTGRLEVRPLLKSSPFRNRVILSGANPVRIGKTPDSALSHIDFVAMTDPSTPLDASEVSVSSFSEAEKEDRAYWHSKTPHERLAALEQMRQINYAYDPVSDRIQRTFEVTTESGIGFPTCYDERVVDELGGVEASIIGLECLKKNKRASG